MRRWEIETDADEYAKRMERRSDILEKEVKEGLLKICSELVGTIQEDISVSVSSAGRSEPYGPPHLETGALRRSVRMEEESGEPLTVVVKAGGGAEFVDYAEYLEYGTHKMLPRPFFFSRAWEARQSLKSFLQEIITRVSGREI